MIVNHPECILNFDKGQAVFILEQIRLVLTITGQFQSNGVGNRSRKNRTVFFKELFG